MTYITPGSVMERNMGVNRHCVSACVNTSQFDCMSISNWIKHMT
jgi:hypothetical protein